MLRYPPILGIDPGLTGAIVLYDRAQNSVIDAHNIPTQTVQINKKARKTLDIPNLLGVVRTIAQQHPDVVACLELVGANVMHGRAQGGRSMFTFGEMNGSLKMALVSAGIDFTLVTPAKWKKALGVTKDDDQIFARASELMPTSTSFWTPKRLVRTKADCLGIAEAAMLAFYYGSCSLRQHTKLAA